MEIIFEEIRERDMDCLLIEEFNVNNEFSINLFKDYIKEIENVNVNNFIAKHSIVDSQYGETDIFVEMSINTTRIILLIENKIDALFQPQQGERYNIRKEIILKENPNSLAYSVLFAPEKYISGHKESSAFDICITYEKIMNYFIHNNTIRDKYKSKIIGLAIEQARRGYNIIEDKRVTKFWKDYWNYLRSNYPYINMKEPTIKPFDADWPLMYLHWLPKYWEIHHKLSKGYIDLQTTLSENEISIYENINKEINVVKTGKSYSLRIIVPKIDRLKDFYIQIDEIINCFNKIKLFEEIKTFHNSKC